jgi:hypothetical protein
LSGAILNFVPLLLIWVLVAAPALIPPVLMKWGRPLTDN